MNTQLASNAEQLATEAENLPAFSGVKVLNIRTNLVLLLELIGRDQLFDEYTRHDISHIDRMLGMLDWLVPEASKEIMTPTDWLITVLAIYFHDLGMLVTKQEFEARNSSGFPLYKDNVLFGGEKGQDYRAKVSEMGETLGERFLYQEFVRQTHAERIRAWLTGQLRDRLGVSIDVVEILDELLSPLTESFREDLAIVCESHHLDDLKQFKKYKVRRPYGNSDAETGNLQYAAILMRTTDLLHITKDRTPTASFKLINPTDPISQEEWAKQMAVTTVRSQLGRDKEGNFDEAAPRDTIEVHARFTKQEGFFALTSYLVYAGEQVRNSYEAAKLANKTQGVRHLFPWRKIDDSNIETKGFLKETFGFTVDQPKILKLLTGHTLYNDTNIVLRELVQNALDAVRLQALIDNVSAQAAWIQIAYDARTRVLSVTDSGTGMSQEVIERHLLTVGASRYEDADFKKNYPTFSAISRFGIGILSTFMIADLVEIVTYSPDEEHARQLSLRSVQGRYLIRLLDKDKDEEARRLAPHGTKVKLKIRHSAADFDVMEIAQRWLVVPECEVTVKIDEDEPVRIGSTTPKGALEKSLISAGISLDANAHQDSQRRICVREAEKDGITVAYALEWSDYYQEWSFLDTSILRGSKRIVLGTCIEGVRVEFSTPGFSKQGIIALANAKGPNAPKTNVARSVLEATTERDAMLSSIYSIYCKHVEREVAALQNERSYSLTRSLQESKFMLRALLEGVIYGSQEGNEPLSRNLLLEVVKDLRIVLVERSGKREALSPYFLQKEPMLWTTESPSFHSAESLIREVPAEVSLSSLATYFHMDLALPPGLFLCGAGPREPIDALALTEKEVDLIVISREHRSVNLRWSSRGSPPKWRSFPIQGKLPTEVLEFLETTRNFSRYRFSPHEGIFGNVFIARDAVDVQGLEDEVGVSAHGNLYFLTNSPFAQLANRWLDACDDNATPEALTASAISFQVGIWAAHRTYAPGETARVIRVIREIELARKSMDLNQLQQILDSGLKMYTPTAWSRDNWY